MEGQRPVGKRIDFSGYRKVLSMREAYRLHQDLLGDAHYTIAFNYLDKEEQPYIVIEKAVCKALKKISGK